MTAPGFSRILLSTNWLIESVLTSPRPPRRTAILDVTFAHLVERGFEGLRVRDVAEGAGINQATLLYHFPDKEELIVAVIGHIIEKARAWILREADPREDSFEGYLRAVGELLSSQPEIFVALNEIAARATRHPKIAAALGIYREGWLHYAEVMLRRAAPKASPSAVKAAASMAIVFLEGLRIHASSTGALATFLKRGKSLSRAESRDRAEAARGIQAQIATFCSLTLSALRARG